MVFFAISRAAFESYSEYGMRSPLWVCAGVISAQELATLRAGNVDVTDFDYTLEPDDWVGISGALETIREHHPSHTVWVGL